MYDILFVKDRIQAPIQGLYILPVSSTETTSPVSGLQEENTGEIIVMLQM